LAEAGYRIAAVNLAKDTATGRQPFEELTPEMRPQDTYGDGRDWTFRTGEHGGDEPDNIDRDDHDRDVVPPARPVGATVKDNRHRQHQEACA
jgi:hypothetical protein